LNELYTKLVSSTRRGAKLMRSGGPVEDIRRKKVQVHNTLRRLGEFIVAHECNPTGQHSLNNQDPLPTNLL
jgi:hypothetical protein